MKNYALALLAFGALTATNAQAQVYTPVDLGPFVNEGFTTPGSWFINGGSFTPIVGTTMGNQGSVVPFQVTDQGGYNYWYGTNTPGDPTSLFGPPGSFTLKANAPGTTSVYTLADNTFNGPGDIAFSVDFNGAGGTFTGVYTIGDNTQDYNSNCVNCLPGASAWYSNGAGQNLHMVRWDLPANFGLQSMTFNQVSNNQGAILAGVTLFQPGAVGGAPEPATWGMMILGFGMAGAALRGRHKVSTQRMIALPA